MTKTTSTRKNNNSAPRCVSCGEPNPDTDRDGYTTCCNDRVTYPEYGSEYEEAKAEWEEANY